MVVNLGVADYRGEEGCGVHPGLVSARAPRTQTPIYQGKRDPYPLGTYRIQH